MIIKVKNWSFVKTLLVRRHSRNVRKPVFGVTNQVRHKPSCTATEDRGSRGIVLSVKRKQEKPFFHNEAQIVNMVFMGEFLILL